MVYQLLRHSNPFYWWLNCIQLDDCISIEWCQIKTDVEWSVQMIYNLKPGSQQQCVALVDQMCYIYASDVMKVSVHPFLTGSVLCRLMWYLNSTIQEPLILVIKRADPYHNSIFPVVLHNLYFKTLKSLGRKSVKLFSNLLPDGEPSNKLGVGP